MSRDFEATLMAFEVPRTWRGFFDGAQGQDRTADTGILDLPAGGADLVRSRAETP